MLPGRRGDLRARSPQPATRRKADRPAARTRVHAHPLRAGRQAVPARRAGEQAAEHGHVAAQGRQADVGPVDGHQLPGGVEAEVAGVEVAVHERRGQPAQLPERPGRGVEGAVQRRPLVRAEQAPPARVRREGVQVAVPGRHVVGVGGVPLALQPGQALQPVALGQVQRVQRGGPTRRLQRPRWRPDRAQRRAHVLRPQPGVGPAVVDPQQPRRPQAGGQARREPALVEPHLARGEAGVPRVQPRRHAGTGHLHDQRPPPPCRRPAHADAEDAGAAEAGRELVDTVERQPAGGLAEAGARGGEELVLVGAGRTPHGLPPSLFSSGRHDHGAVGALRGPARGGGGLGPAAVGPAQQRQQCVGEGPPPPDVVVAAGELGVVHLAALGPQRVA